MHRGDALSRLCREARCWGRRMRLRMSMWWLVVRRIEAVVARLVGSLCALRLRSRVAWRCRLYLGRATPWWCVVCGLGAGCGAHVKLRSRSRCATQSRNAKIRGEIAPPRHHP